MAELASRPARRMPRVVLGVLVGQACLVGLYVWVERDRVNRHADPFSFERLAAPAPELVLTRPDGTSTNLSALRGRAVLLHFWATWCAPCRVELPRLLALGREIHRADEARIIAAVVDDDWPAVRDFFGGEIPAEVVAVRSEAAERFGVSVLPDTYVVDAEGMLRLRIRGARDWQDRFARQLIAEAD